MILQGQVAIVTGAGQGIGKAISSRFAREGADIGILDINGKTATKTAEEILNSLAEYLSKISGASH